MSDFDRQIEDTKKMNYSVNYIYFRLVIKTNPCSLCVINIIQAAKEKLL